MMTIVKDLHISNKLDIILYRNIVRSGVPNPRFVSLQPFINSIEINSDLHLLPSNAQSFIKCNKIKTDYLTEML